MCYRDGTIPDDLHNALGQQAGPQDIRYHLELRTDLYLRDPVFEIPEKHGVGQVLSHWTWLPPLRKQLAKADGKFFNAGKHGVVRLLTPWRMRYEDSFDRPGQRREISTEESIHSE